MSPASTPDGSGALEQYLSTGRGRSTALAALSVLALGVRVIGLGRRALWIDELSRVTYAKGYEFDRVFDVLAGETGVRLPPLSLGRALAVVSAHNPPLNGAVLNLWLRVTGDPSDGVARLPSALFSAASVPVTYLALRSRFGERPALAAATLVALSPFQVYYAQEVNHYALAFLLVAITFFYFLRYEERPALGTGIGWALSGAAAVYTHYYAGIVILCQWLSLLPTARTRRWSLISLFGPPASMIVLVLPYVPLVRGQLAELTEGPHIGSFAGTGYFVDRLRATLAMPYLGERGNHATWAGSSPVIALSIAACAFGLSKLPRRERWLWLVNAVAPLLVVSAAYFLTHSNSFLWPRYQLFFSFALFALVGIGVASLRVARAVRAGAVILGLFALGHAYQWQSVLEDWRTVAARIDRGATPEDAVLVYRQNLVYSIARYLRGNNHLFGVGPTKELEQILGVIVGAEPPHSGVWYASAWPESNQMADRMVSFLGRHYARCVTESVDPGVVDLHLIHCTELRVASDGAPDDIPSWWRPRGGPLREGGWVETRTDAGVGGWTFSSAGMRAVRLVVDGKTVAEAPHRGVPRPDVSNVFAAFPRELTEPSGFFVPLHGGSGLAARAHVFGVRADGTLLELPGEPR